MTRNAWLCPTDLDRSRLLEASERVRRSRTFVSGAIGAALVVSGPWLGWSMLILVALAAATYLQLDRRLEISARPERVTASASMFSLALLAAGVIMSGGPHSPTLSWVVFPAALVAARFRRRVVIAMLATTVLVVLLCTLAVDPSSTLSDPVPVIATLTLLAGVVSIVLALQGAELQHRSEAILDPLTGLLNRHALARRFEEISLQAHLTGAPVCMVLCDIDDFKAINDAYGHDGGDAVLRDVAYALRKHLRSFELIYRLGGEEFLIVLPGVAPPLGREMAERLRVAVECVRPLGRTVTASLGVSGAEGEDVDYETLFKAADVALYAAKRDGRNRVVVAPRGGEVARSADARASSIEPCEAALTQQAEGSGAREPAIADT